MNDIDRREFLKLFASGVFAAVFGPKMEQLEAVVGEPSFEVLDVPRIKASEFINTPGKTYRIVYRWWKADGQLNKYMTIDDVPVINDIVNLKEGSEKGIYGAEFHNSIYQIFAPTEAGTLAYKFTPRGKSGWSSDFGGVPYVNDSFSYIDDVCIR